MPKDQRKPFSAKLYSFTGPVSGPETRTTQQLEMTFRWYYYDAGKYPAEMDYERSKLEEDRKSCRMYVHPTTGEIIAMRRLVSQRIKNAFEIPHVLGETKEPQIIHFDVGRDTEVLEIGIYGREDEMPELFIEFVGLHEEVDESECEQFLTFQDKVTPIDVVKLSKAPTVQPKSRFRLRTTL